jgi:predicted alpha-1,2-mannosidase
VADAVVKGVPGIDAENAYARLRAAAMDPVAPAGGRGGRNEVERYMQFGYVPTTGGRSVSLTVEYAHDDYALSNLARFLGHNDDADVLAARAHSWRALVDPGVGGFPRGKREDGTWDTLPFQPEDFSEYFAEATSWQTLFGAPHDVEGLMLVLGGREAAVEKLRVFCQNGRDEFEAPREDPLAFGTFMHPWLWPSNEPSLHIPYMFAQLGRPDLTQQWVTWMRRNYFSDEPAGVPGNDDGGTMGAWVVFTALGFYPVPGGTEYVVGTPLFPRAHLKVVGGEFTVEAVGVSDENVYVQKATLNGVELTEPRFHHADIHAGCALRLEMGPSPARWGVLP